MQKEKRTENKEILEVAGRDQQDQRLELNFNRGAMCLGACESRNGALERGSRPYAGCHSNDCD